MRKKRGGRPDFDELEGLRVVESVEIELPASPTGEGAAALAELTVGEDVGPPPPGAIPGEVSVRLMEEAGIELTYFDGRVPRLRLVVSEGRRLAVRSLGEDGGIWRDREAPEVLDLILTRGPFLIESELLVEMNAAVSPPRASFKLLEATPDASTEPLVAPWPEWLADCQDDWVKAQLATRSGLRDTWQQLAAVGFFVRLREDGAADNELEPRPTLSAEVLAPRVWFRALGESRWREVESLLDSEVVLLERDLDELRSELAPLDDSWRRRLVSFLTARDDVEGVRVLLLDVGRIQSAAQAGPTEPPPPSEQVIREFDRMARPFIVMLPKNMALDDERLSRVLRHDPAAWWAEPAGG